MAIRSLIVEDEVIIRMNLVRMIKKNQIDVVGEASSGEEAIELCKSLNPDLVFMDIRLSGQIDGVEAALEISSMSSAKIIFMSAFDLQENEKISKITNFHAYLRKPVTENNIKNLSLALE